MGKARGGKQKRKRYSWVNLVLAGLVVSGLVTALFLSGDGGSSGVSSQISFSGDRFETVSAGELPSFAKGAGQKTKETYRYAAAHPEVLQYIPCTCGCRNSGHRHNGDCYVKDRHTDGRITFTSHAAT
jgi:hypothetical protein